MPRHTFPKSRRLGGKLAFSAVFEGKTRESRGPLTMYAIPSDTPLPRLGISIGRKVGNAVRRNRIKRLLRESFRLHQHDLPRPYNFTIVVRPHEPLILAEYQKLMTALMLKLHSVWSRRGPSLKPGSDPGPQPQPAGG